jgi:hypothetical protein
MALMKTGAAFPDETVQEVWEKGAKITGVDWDVFRTDACGAWMCRTEYGSRDAELGWEIDHIFPQSEGGGDEIDNLRPLHFQNNIKKSNELSWDASKDGANVPPPVFAVLLHASGKIGIYPASARLKSVDDFENYIATKWQAKTSEGRGRQLAALATARVEAANGRVDGAAYSLRAAIEAKGT